MFTHDTLLFISLMMHLNLVVLLVVVLALLESELLVNVCARRVVCLLLFVLQFLLVSRATIETDRHKDGKTRHTDREVDRQVDRQMHRRTGRHTDRETSQTDE